jgi:hypothetical protein
LIRRERMATVFEDLSVELIYDIFLYFQYYEIWNLFSDLNSRFTAMINKMSFMPIYLGFNGMSIALIEFYSRHLSQPNVFNSLISLCVSDKGRGRISNGKWDPMISSAFHSGKVWRVLLKQIQVKLCTLKLVFKGKYGKIS